MDLWWLWRRWHPGSCASSHRNGWGHSDHPNWVLFDLWKTMSVVTCNVPLKCSARIRPSASDFSLHTVDVHASRHMLAHLAVKHGLMLNGWCLRGWTAPLSYLAGLLLVVPLDWHLWYCQVIETLEPLQAHYHPSSPRLGAVALTVESSIIIASLYMYANYTSILCR